MARRSGGDLVLKYFNDLFDGQDCPSFSRFSGRAVDDGKCAFRLSFSFVRLLIVALACIEYIGAILPTISAISRTQTCIVLCSIMSKGVLLIPFVRFVVKHDGFRVKNQRFSHS